MKKIVVAGGGVLGSQIAYQAAYCGFDVTIWLRSEGSITRTQPKLDHLKDVYFETIEKMATPEGQTPANWARGLADFDTFDKDECLKKAENAYNGLKLELDMAKAVADADLVIESMAGKPGRQDRVLQEVSAAFAGEDRAGHQFLHAFALQDGQVHRPSGEVPVAALRQFHLEEQHRRDHGAGEDGARYFDEVMKFAEEIRMIPLPVRKEKSGYLLNSMLVPLLFSGMDLFVNGVSDPESIDKAWTLGTGAPKGPFQFSIPWV